MALIEWSDEYSVRVQEMDSQHKKLVAMINDLHDAMKAGKGKDVLEAIIKGVVDYAGVHFADEERLLKTHGYAEHLQQRTKHQELNKQVQEFHRNFGSGKTVLTVEVMQFLKDWLVTHIKGMDKKYGPYLNGKGVS